MFFKHKDPTSGGKAWGIAVAMVLMNLIYSVASTYGQYLGQVVAMRMRTSCTAILTRKVRHSFIVHLHDCITRGRLFSIVTSMYNERPVLEAILNCNVHVQMKAL